MFLEKSCTPQNCTFSVNFLKLLINTRTWIDDCFLRLLTYFTAVEAWYTKLSEADLVKENWIDTRAQRVCTVVGIALQSPLVEWYCKYHILSLIWNNINLVS